MSIPEEIGRNLLFLRKVRNVSREWLSLESNTSQSQLYAIELGLSNPKVETLAKLAYALDVPFELLFVRDLASQFAPLMAAQEYYDKPVTFPEFLFLYKALGLFRQGKLKLEE